MLIRSGLRLPPSPIWFFGSFECSPHLVGHSDLTILRIKVNKAWTTTLKVHREITPTTVARIGFIMTLINPTQVDVLEQGRIHWLVQTSLPAPMMRLQVVMKRAVFRKVLNIIIFSFYRHHWSWS
jgi:hypothetical protein